MGFWDKKKKEKENEDNEPVERDEILARIAAKYPDTPQRETLYREPKTPREEPAPERVKTQIRDEEDEEDEVDTMSDEDEEDEYEPEIPMRRAEPKHAPQKVSVTSSLNEDSKQHAPDYFSGESNDEVVESVAEDIRTDPQLERYFLRKNIVRGRRLFIVDVLEYIPDPEDIKESYNPIYGGGVYKLYMSKNPNTQTRKVKEWRFNAPPKFMTETAAIERERELITNWKKDIEEQNRDSVAPSVSYPEMGGQPGMMGGLPFQPKNLHEWIMIQDMQNKQKSEVENQRLREEVQNIKNQQFQLELERIKAGHQGTGMDLAGFSQTIKDAQALGALVNPEGGSNMLNSLISVISSPAGSELFGQLAGLLGDMRKNNFSEANNNLQDARFKEHAYKQRLIAEKKRAADREDAYLMDGGEQEGHLTQTNEFVDYAEEQPLETQANALEEDDFGLSEEKPGMIQQCAAKLVEVTHGSLPQDVAEIAVAKYAQLYDKPKEIISAAMLEGNRLSAIQLIGVTINEVLLEKKLGIPDVIKTLKRKGNELGLQFVGTVSYDQMMQMLIPYKESVTIGQMVDFFGQSEIKSYFENIKRGLNV